MSPDAMSAEFDTVAAWTAQAARELGPEYYVPAGCRGSGGTGALDWLLARLPSGPLLDVGAGVGGPAGYAHQHAGFVPTLVEPEFGACRAASSLFGFDVLCAGAAALPVASASFPAVWSLGVLCTTADHLRVLGELARALTPDGRLGLVVYSAVARLDEQPEGNNFPLRDELRELLAAGGLQVLDRVPLDDLPSSPRDWQDRQDAVHQRVEDEHGNDEAFEESVRQGNELGELLSDGSVIGDVLIAQRAS